MTPSRCLLPAAFLASILPVFADELGTPKKKDDRFPAGDPAKQNAEAALKGFSIAPGLKVEVWASEPLLANPVALTFDNEGRAYVAETNRRRTSVPDIRKYEEWTIENFALRSVEQRVAFFKAKFPESAHAKPTKDRADINGDGQFDWRDLGFESEKIRVVEDSNRDGKADQSRFLAEGFNSVSTGVGAGVCVLDDEVFYTCTPDVWKIHLDGTKEKLFTGFGVHVAYSGHDMHGAKIGPDGKLYWSIADCGAHVVGKDGKVLIDNPDSGAVFRCNPDGSDLELVCKGLRNPQSLAFNDVGDLFTGDNNADGGDKARWTHVVEGADYGWRIGWQFLPKLGAWNSEGMWHLDAAETHFSILPCVGHIGHGPAGIAYYPGTGLPEAYRDHFFYADFPGGIRSFKLTPKGSSYTVENPGDILMDNSPQKMTGKILWSLYPSDVAFAPGGGLYVLDWVQGWEKTEKGRIFRVFDPATDSSTIVQETKKLLNEGFAKKSTDDLVKLLGHADQRVRLGAQFALVANKNGAEALAKVARSGSGLAQLHAIWGLGMVDRKAGKGASNLAEVLPELIASPTAEVRAQAARVAGERAVGSTKAALLQHLKDENPRVRFFAAQSLGRLKATESVPALFDLVQNAMATDAHLRHAGVAALAELAGEDALARKANDPSESVRTTALLALERKHSTSTANWLGDSNVKIVREAAHGIHDGPVPSAWPALAELALKSDLPEPVWRRALNANYLVGTKEAAQRLARIATNARIPVEERLFALESLAIWNAPFGRDRVTGLWRDLPPRTEAKGAREVAAQIVPVLLTDPNESIRLAASDLAGAVVAKEVEPALLGTVSDPKAGGKVRAAALRALGTMDSPKTAEAVKVALADKDQALLEAARKLAAKASPADAVKVNAAVLGKGTIREQQEALATIAQQPGAEADQILAAQLELLATGKLPAALWLDLLEAAAQRTDTNVKARIAAIQQSKNGADPLVNWRECLEGGDAKLGRQIFFEKAEAACLRCHKIKGEGGDVGPDLAGIGQKQNREYILRSIVDPNAMIAPGFENVMVTLTDGNIAAGILSAEDPKTVTLKSLADGTPQKIEKAKIKERTAVPSAMPPGLGDVLGKRGLRDVIEFLATVK